MIINSVHYLLRHKPGLARLLLHALERRGCKYSMSVDELTDAECVTACEKVLEALEPVH